MCVSIYSIYVFSCNPSTVFVFLPIERSSRSGQSEPLKPDSLLRLSLGGVTLTVLEQDPPPGPDGLSSLAEVSRLFFHELVFFKDGMFSERDFHNLRGNFAKACPHSHIRYGRNYLLCSPTVYACTLLLTLSDLWSLGWPVQQCSWLVRCVAQVATPKPRPLTSPSAGWNCWSACGTRAVHSTQR